MRNDEQQLIKDKVDSTSQELYDTAVDLYEAVGPSAVIEWGRRIGLRSSPCIPCEQDTPEIGDGGNTYCCAVCGSAR
jgi:hypothetical protein